MRFLSGFLGGGGGGGNQLVWMLRVQLAEALNLQDRNLVAKLYETMRCLETFDANGCRELVRALKEDYKVSQLELDYLDELILFSVPNPEEVKVNIKTVENVTSS